LKEGRREKGGARREEREGPLECLKEGRRKWYV
jgi:hypothetical protein